MISAEQLHIAHLQSELRGERRKRAAESFTAFARLYLSNHLRAPDGAMHRELYGLLQELAPGQRMAIAAPRRSAKSTLVSLAYILWLICLGRVRFVILISDTADKAGDMLGNLKEELVRNNLLAGDFPEVCEVGGKFPRRPRWSSHEIVTHNGIKVSALGSGQNIRGQKYRESRPDLILLDDVECRDNTHSADARQKLRGWFEKEVLMAGTAETRFLVVGTILHYDSLLARLTDGVKSPFWTGRIYRSVIRWSPRRDLWETWAALLHQRQELDGRTGPAAAASFFSVHRDAMLADTEVLWPAVEDYCTLMRMRESEGPASFDSEKQNEPVNPQECYFLEEEFQFWEERFAHEGELIASVRRKEIYGACDPSLGRTGRHGDDSAIVTLLRDADSGRLYVLDADIARRRPDQIIETILNYQRIRKYAGFGFETNQFQAFLADELKRRAAEQKLYLPVRDLPHYSDKLGRIQGLQPLIRSGTLQFSRRHLQLLEQLRHFPKAAHDDGPDALEMAVETARRHPVIDWSAACVVPGRALEVFG